MTFLALLLWSSSLLTHCFAGLILELAERALQILKQVAGRAGRADKPGKVLIQTYQPEHPVLQVLGGAVSEEAFLEQERELRQALNYPPLGALSKFESKTTVQAEAQAQSQEMRNALIPWEAADQLEILDQRSFLEMAKGVYRWDILLKGKDLKRLRQAAWVARELGNKKKWHFFIDIDPSGVN